MANNFRKNLLVSFGISLALLIISSTASFTSIQNLLGSNAWVNHTQEVIINSNRCTAIIVDAQNSIRAFLLTGKTRFLQDFKSAEANSDAYYRKLKWLTSDNSRQRRNLAQFKPRKDSLFHYLNLRVAEKMKGVSVTAEQLDEGKKLMDAVRQSVKKIDAEEQFLLKYRIATSEKYGYYSSALIVIAALLALLISIVFFVRILNDFRVRNKLQRALELKDEETERRIKAISGIADQISKGNYEIRVDDTESDALGSVGDSLNNMAHALDHSFSMLSDKEWMQAGIAQLNNVMIGEKTLNELTRDIAEFVAIYTNSNAGALYLTEGEWLYAAAGYSYVPDKSRERIRAGDGLTGQAMISRKIVELTALSPEDIRISYALGEVKPTHVVAVPLIDTNVEGVLELAGSKPFTPLHLEFLNTIGNNIGIALRASQNRKRVQELLEETQSQSEELRVQHSELEGMNAELEAQTEKLQASEEELRVQQEELQQTNEELAERSVLLEEKNTEIQKKSEDLELTTRYKSEFLANMSHELRTPLNSILLLSRLLAENNDQNMNSEQIEFAKVIQSSGNGLLGLIDEILDLSKIEAGKMDLEVLDVATKEITDNLKDLFTALAREKNIEFRIVSDNAPLVIKTDKMRLEQILKNLISNAIKFTAEGSVTLEIKKHASDAKAICFIVTDTGIGIPREKQPLIFEAFQQADGSTKRKYGGTGLGLSISRELAKLLNGEITLESHVGQGSTFTLMIPLFGSVIERPAKREVSHPQPESAKIQNENQKNKYLSPSIPHDVPDDREAIGPEEKAILIVEDDTAFAKSLLEFTRRRGYKGIVSVRGDHALNLALAYKPVGILLDIQLPIKSGWEVLDELKGNPQTKHIPVHIMSSHKLKQESLLKGAVNFLDKPVAFEQMPDVFRRIEQIISKESQKVLIIEDNPKHAKALAYFLETYQINSEIRSDVSEGVAALKQTDVDCVILDMGVPDKQAYEILDGVKKNPGLENLPVIVFTGKSLSIKEESKIKKYADSIVVKTAHSYQRMLDEVSLFLHLMEENKKSGGGKANKRNMDLMNNILSGKTVLVVDDDVRNIYSLTKALEVLKMNVITAIDGSEALKMLAQHPETDVVLLDMMMPNMDGYETATLIRQNAKLKNLPVIAVTAKAMTGDREKCINAGASDYITKPVDIDQLLSLLRVWLYDKN